MRVLFVCAGNAHRSPLAEALLKKLRPDVQTDSAGLRVAIPISEEAKKYLARENAQQYIKQTPESLDEKNLNQYDLIVVMEPRYRDAVLTRCPECADKIQAWDIRDPYFSPPEQGEKIYEQIKQNVKKLADSL